jgi:hypothetical protein
MPHGLKHPSRQILLTMHHLEIAVDARLDEPSLQSELYRLTLFAIWQVCSKIPFRLWRHGLSGERDGVLSG